MWQSCVGELNSELGKMEYDRIPAKFQVCGLLRSLTYNKVSIPVENMIIFSELSENVLVTNTTKMGTQVRTITKLF